MTLRTRLMGVGLLILLLARPGAPDSLALMTDGESTSSTVATADSFDVTPPVVTSSTIAKVGEYSTGFVRATGQYYVYANATDAGSTASGVADVRADVGLITSGATAVQLNSGSYSVGGVAYAYRSVALTADSALPEGARSYEVTATDAAGNGASRDDFVVTVDNTQPGGVDVQATNAAGTAGRPDAGDRLTYTFSEPIDPASVLGGWNGDAVAVVVRISDGGLLGADSLTVRNASNTSTVAVGTVGLGASGYVSATRDFGASGTPSSMSLVGNTIVVTLGTPSGSTGTELLGGTMTWTPSGSSTDRAGNSCRTTSVNESSTILPDAEF